MNPYPGTSASWSGDPTSMIIGARDLHPNRQMLKLGVLFGTIAGLGLVFQVGHFAEHAFQFTVWVLGDLSNICGRDTPWMSPWVTDMVRQTGVLLFPAADESRRMMLGMELLHLVGNGIFLVGLASLYYCVRSKWVRWAFYIEAFHLYEHIMLTATAFFIGKPIGLSTFFGGVNVVGGREFAVGCRVTWHFAMNLLPMPFAIIGLMEHIGALRPPPPRLDSPATDPSGIARPHT